MNIIYNFFDFFFCFLYFLHTFFLLQKNNTVLFMYVLHNYSSIILVYLHIVLIKSNTFHFYLTEV
ncbi:hypothetical protein RUMOBE_03927 [Blautia obeum ATCC 29174]|uniref:Uncharacterized protein n=1 Tax=Blautia obeum ATCC 29174 TaxID=411459 RepID=A5ZY21_9FIRM|nr:hypothetical protein RUMOBE_03927 [Blautia obeum ATCC 29174]